MGRIVPCRLVMKVTVMVLLSSVPTFPLLLLNMYNKTLWRRKVYTTRLSRDGKTKRFPTPDLHVKLTKSSINE